MYNFSVNTRLLWLLTDDKITISDTQILFFSGFNNHYTKYVHTIHMFIYAMYVQ